MVENSERYIRQIQCKDFGVKGQEALSNASVIVIGAGGLACSLLQYLVSMGVGKIGIVDFDIVSISNLHRQILYSDQDIGLKKAEVAKRRLNNLNSCIEIEAFTIKLVNSNANELICNYNIVVDCTDNLETKYLINDICYLLNKPLVFASISKYEGQVAVFNILSGSGEISGNYRDLFPFENAKPTLNCNDDGVLGILPGIIGCIQASEVIKLIVGTGEILVNKLLYYNMLKQSFNVFNYSSKQCATIPKSIDELQKYNYSIFNQCDLDDDLLDSRALVELLDGTDTDFCLVDIREDYEIPKVVHTKVIQIPIEYLSNELSKLSVSKIILFCQKGQRSRIATSKAKLFINKTKAIYSLSGGVFSFPNSILKY
jgi:molybdopterin/thiamine biosynthesis adenylyltransferase/rhodanese-related sulfurtransferase